MQCTASQNTKKSELFSRYLYGVHVNKTISISIKYSLLALLNFLVTVKAAPHACVIRTDLL